MNRGPIYRAALTTVHELVNTHLTTTRTEDGPVTAPEPPLLLILERTVASNSGRGSTAGVSGEGGPLNLGALELLRRIQSDLVEAGYPGMEPRAALASWWTDASREDEPEEGLRILLEVGTRWIDGIRELLDPTRRVPMKDTACPGCGNTHVYAESSGETVRTPAVVLYPGCLPPEAECMACGTSWSGGELLDLREGRMPASATEGA